METELADIELDPPFAIRRYIERVVDNQLHDSPVRYAFDDGWPVELLETEADELLTALQVSAPDPMNPAGQEHRHKAIKEVATKMNRGP